MRFLKMSVERQLLVFAVLFSLGVLIVCCPDVVQLWQKP